MKQEKNIKRGKKSRKSGADFELRVRADLESKGWIVDKWTNNVSDYFDKNINLPPEEREDRRLIPAKPKWNNFTKSMMMGKGGFPDFIAFKFYKGYNDIKTYEIIGVECKTRGYLNKIEKEKCEWLINNHIFGKILVAKKTKVKNRIVIEYSEFVHKANKEEAHEQ